MAESLILTQDEIRIIDHALFLVIMDKSLPELDIQPLKDKIEKRVKELDE